MKSIWGKFLSCFLAVNLFMMSMMSAVFAKTHYRLNGMRDGLDVVLNAIVDYKDWAALDAICDKGMVNSDGSYTKKYFDTKEDIVKIFNKEIRSNYGNTLINTFRNTEYNPGYGKILRDTADKLGIRVPDELTTNDIEPVERLVIGKVVEMIKDNMLKEDGGNEKWDKIENDALAHVDELFAQGKISTNDYASIKKYGVAGLFTAAGSLGLAGSLSGLAVYSLANSLFWAIAGGLGITSLFTVVTVAPWIAWLVGCATNPLAWGPAFVVGIFAIGDTNWKKTIPSVFYIAMMRQKLMAEGKL